jgi:hypothetical protein
MSKNKAPAAPKYAGLVKAQQKAADAASKASADTQKRADAQYELAKKSYGDNQTLNQSVADSLIGAMNDQRGAAAEDRARYKSAFQPLEDQLIADSNTYNSPAKRDLEQGRAIAGVGQQFDAARSNAQRDLEAYGIDPSSTRYAGLDIGVRTQQAAAEAAASDAAARNVENTGRELRGQAISVGQRLPAQSVAEFQSSQGAGNSAVGNANQTTQTGFNTMGTAPQYGALGVDYMNAGTNATNSAGTIQNAGYANQLAAFNANQQASSGWGQLAGTALGIGAKMAFAPATGGASMLLAGGGAIPDPGGGVPTSASPTGGKAIDDVPAKLTAGEFVIPLDVAKWKGEEFFQKLIVSSRQAKTGAPAKPQAKQAALPVG